MPARSSLWALLLCQCVLTAGLTLSFPFFALYLHKDRGLPMDQVGLAISVMILTTAVAQSLGGEFSDLIGSKAVMEWSIATRGLLCLGLAYAIHAQWATSCVIAFNILGAFCGNFYDPAVRAWLAEAYPAGERVRAYGLQRIAVNLGWAVGPAVGGLLAERSYALLFGASGLVCGACLSVMHLGVARQEPQRGGEAFSWSQSLSAGADGRFLRFCILSLMIAVVMGQLVVGLSVHSTTYAGLSPREVGFLFGINGLVVVLLQREASRRLAGRRISYSLAGGCLLYALGFAWVGLVRGFSLMAAAVVIVTLGEIVVSPGLHALAANLAPERLKGRYLGFHGLSHQVGSALGPLLGGLGLRYLSPLWTPAPWLLVGGMGTAAGIGFFGLSRALKPHEEGLEAS